jgi:ABC-2 type transport system ATP-binding protein
VPLPDAGQVFDGLPSVNGWQASGAGDTGPARDSGAASDYVIAVGDPTVAAPAVTRALVTAGADGLSIGESRHSLEDVYLELIDEDEEARQR